MRGEMAGNSRGSRRRRLTQPQPPPGFRAKFVENSVPSSATRAGEPGVGPGAPPAGLAQLRRPADYPPPTGCETSLSGVSAPPARLAVASLAHLGCRTLLGQTRGGSRWRSCCRSGVTWMWPRQVADSVHFLRHLEREICVHLCVLCAFAEFSPRSLSTLSLVS